MDVPRAYNLRRRRTPLEHAKFLILNGSPETGFEQLVDLYENREALQGDPHSRAYLSTTLGEMADNLRQRSSVNQNHPLPAAYERRAYEASVAYRRSIWDMQEVAGDMKYRGLVITEAELDALINATEVAADNFTRTAKQKVWDNPDLVMELFPAQQRQLFQFMPELRARMRQEQEAERNEEYRLKPLKVQFEDAGALDDVD